MGRRTHKSPLDIPPAPRDYGCITCMEVLERRLSYNMHDREIKVHYDGVNQSYMILHLTLDADHKWQLVEDLHFFHFVCQKLNLTYNQFLNAVKALAIKQWGNLK